MIVFMPPKCRNDFEPFRHSLSSPLHSAAREQLHIPYRLDFLEFALILLDVVILRVVFGPPKTECRMEFFT